MERESINNRFLSLYKQDPKEIIMDLTVNTIPENVREELDNFIHRGCDNYRTDTNNPIRICYNYSYEEVEGEDAYIYKGVKLHKRILKYIKEVMNRKWTFTSSDLEKYFPASEMGNIIFNSVSSGKYLYDIVAEFDWDQGDFGDHGSCFWECRDLVRSWMSYHHFFAFRLYDEKGKGRARMWIYLDRDKDSLYCFNGYGEKLVVMAGMLKKLLNCDQKSLELNNGGESTGFLYINGGSGIQLADNLDDEDEYDIPEDTSDYVCCEGCDQYIDASDGPYCENCGGCTCDRCGEHTRDEDTYNVGGDIWCEYCTNNYATYCDCCNEYYITRRETMTEVHGEYYCEQCLRDNFTECDDCNELVSNDDVQYLKDGSYCENCAVNHQEEVEDA